MLQWQLNPLRLLHLLQLHKFTTIGLRSVSNLTAPQWQPPICLLTYLLRRSICYILKTSSPVYYVTLFKIYELSYILYKYYKIIIKFGTKKRQGLKLTGNSRNYIYAYFLPKLGQPLCCPLFR